MRLEFRLAGYEVQFAALNGADGFDDQLELSHRCSFPIFQDDEDTDAWSTFDGEKDDFYVYDAAGELAAYLPARFGPSTNLASDEGYTYVRDTILEVLGR